MPRITVAPHTPALAADFNAVSDQSIMRFPTAAARTAAIPTPTEGMHTYRDDVDAVEFWDGTGWVNSRSDRAMCAFAFHRSADFTWPGDGYNNMSLDVAAYDPAGVFNAGGGNGSFRAPRNGRVMFHARMGFSLAGAQQGNLTSIMSLASSPTGVAPFTDNLLRGSTSNCAGSQIVGGADYGVILSASFPVSAGVYYLPRPYLSSPGLTKTVFGQATNTYFHGYYLTP